MPLPPIIEVRLDDDGATHYRIRTTLLNTKGYGVLLATLARQIGVMMQHEEPKIDARIATAEISQYFQEEIDQPTALDATLHPLQ